MITLHHLDRTCVSSFSKCEPHGDCDHCVEVSQCPGIELFFKRQDFTGRGIFWEVGFSRSSSLAQACESVRGFFKSKNYKGQNPQWIDTQITFLIKVVIANQGVSCFSGYGKAHGMIRTMIIDMFKDAKIAKLSNKNGSFEVRFVPKGMHSFSVNEICYMVNIEPRAKLISYGGYKYI